MAGSSRSGIDLLKLHQFLNGTGWKKLSDQEFGSEWSVRHGGRTRFAFVPSSEDFDDFNLRMDDLVRTLTHVRNVSDAELAKEISLFNMDVVRVPKDNPDTQDGTLPLDHGEALIKHARSLMMAAACAAVEHRPYFHTRRPPQASAYMDRLRLGQTERGSFILTVLSPIHGDETPLFGAGYERTVTKGLVDALAATEEAAASGRLGRLNSLKDMVSVGVTGNLFEALVALGTDEDVRVSVSWAPVLPGPVQKQGGFQFPRDVVGQLKASAAALRDLAPPPDRDELYGWIIALRHPEGDPVGRATLQTRLNKKTVNVRLDLEGEDYRKVVRAHENEQAVRCRGRLERHGNQFVFHEVHDIVVLQGQAPIL